MGMFAYTVFGSVKESSIGPTAVMALMTFSYANEGGAAYAALLSFLAGIIELCAGLLNLGKLLHSGSLLLNGGDVPSTLK